MTDSENMKMETYSKRISTYRAQTFLLQTIQYNAKGL